MHTGDLAEMREDGCCNVVGPGRAQGGPRRQDVQVIGVPDELPMTVTGKIRKVETQEKTTAQLG